MAEVCALPHATGCLFFLHSSLNNAAAVTLEVNGEFWCCLCESEEPQTDQVGVDYILITSLIQAADWSAPHSPTLSLTLDTSVCLAGDSSSYI